jgi:hypothetical protein
MYLFGKVKNHTAVGQMSRAGYPVIFKLHGDFLARDGCVTFFRQAAFASRLAPSGDFVVNQGFVYPAIS